MPDLSTNVQAGQAGHPALHNAERTEINALRARRVITPRDFGDLPSYNNLDTDCTDVLEAFLEAAAEDDSREFALEGAYGITRGLVVSGLARRSMRCALEIRALSEIEGYGLSFEAVTHKSLPGYCVYDNQTTNYRNRLAHRGFLVGPAAFNARLPDLHATGVKGFAVDCIVNSNFALLGKVFSGMCGTRTASSAGREYRVGYELLENAGGNNSVTQRSVLAVDEPPPPKDLTPLVKIGDKYHLWMEEDPEAGTISVFPWVSPTVGETGDLDFITGGTLRVWGNGANGVHVDKLTGFQAGITLYSASPAGVKVGSFGTEFSEIGICLGRPGLNVAVGNEIGQPYFEATRVDLVQTTMTSANLTLGNNFSYSTGFAFQAQTTGFTKDVNGGSPDVFFADVSQVDRRASYRDTAAVAVTNARARGRVAAEIETTTPDRALALVADFDAERVRARGHDRIEVELFGYLTGEVTVTSADESVTVEGGASYVIGGVGKAYARLMLVYRDGDIRVYLP